MRLAICKHSALRCLSVNAWSPAVFGQPCRLHGEKIEAVVRLRKRASVSDDSRPQAPPDSSKRELIVTIP